MGYLQATKKNKMVSQCLHFINEYDQVIFIIILLIGLVFFVRFKISKVDKDGIITISKVIRYEGAEAGSDLYIEIYLENKTYVTSINQECQYDCIGNYFFVRVSKNQPTEYPIFYGNRMVPKCILDKIKYFEGWTNFPTCDSMN